MGSILKYYGEHWQGVRGAFVKTGESWEHKGDRRPSLPRINLKKSQFNCNIDTCEEVWQEKRLEQLSKAKV